MGSLIIEPIALPVLAIQAEQIKRNIEALRVAARRHGLTFAPEAQKFDDTEALCLGAELLLGQIWAGFHTAAKAQEEASVAQDPRA